MSINILVADWKLFNLSGEKVTKDKITEALGCTLLMKKLRSEHIEFKHSICHWSFRK